MDRLILSTFAMDPSVLWQWEQLGFNYKIVRDWDRLDIQQKNAWLNQTEIFVIRSQTPIERDFFQKHPQVRLVISATNGLDHIDPFLETSLDHRLCYTPEGHSDSTAHLTVTMALALGWHLGYHTYQLLSHYRWERTFERQEALEGSRTWGIVGFGHVGQKVALRAQALGFQVVAYDPFADEESFQIQKVQRVGFFELLKLSDVVSVHVPLTHLTRGMFHPSLFEHIGEPFFWINTSRGPVATPEFIQQGLAKGFLKGVGLDVFDKEPPSKAFLEALRPFNVILTPHVGSYTHNSWKQTSQAVHKRVMAYVQGKPIPNLFPPPLAWFEDHKKYLQRQQFVGNSSQKEPKKRSPS